MDKVGILKRRLIAYSYKGAAKAYVFEVEVKTSTTHDCYHIAVSEQTFAAHKDGSVFEWDEDQIT
jgi:hypothetical protein